MKRDKIANYINKEQVSELEFIDEMMNSDCLTDVEKKDQVIGAFERIGEKVFMAYITCVINKNN
jgi:hypothetical protein